MKAEGFGFTFKEGDRVKYAAHPVTWRSALDEDGRPHLESPAMHHSADGRWPMAVTVSEEEAKIATKIMRELHGPDHPGIEPQGEDWRPATVIAVDHVPIMAHLNRSTPDEVVKLQPDDGQPPFDLNALLVRPLDA